MDLVPESIIARRRMRRADVSQPLMGLVLAPDRQCGSIAQRPFGPRRRREPFQITTPLSWNESKARALVFSREWKGEGSERAEAQSFWNGFFDVFGVDRRRVAVFEKQVDVTRAGRRVKHGRIDLFWKGVLLVEHKSRDQDLDRAFRKQTYHT